MLNQLIKDDEVLNVIEKWINEFEIKIDSIENDIIYSEGTNEDDIKSFCEWIIFNIEGLDNIKDYQEYFDNMKECNMIKDYVKSLLV